MECNKRFLIIYQCSLKAIESYMTCSCSSAHHATDIFQVEQRKILIIEACESCREVTKGVDGAHQLLTLPYGQVAEGLRNDSAFRISAGQAIGHMGIEVVAFTRVITLEAGQRIAVGT